MLSGPVQVRVMVQEGKLWPHYHGLGPNKTPTMLSKCIPMEALRLPG